MEKSIQLPHAIWQRLNLSWVVFFLISAFLNIYFAFYYCIELSAEMRQAAWVDFKFYGLFGLSFLFIILQAIYLQKHIPINNPEPQTEEE
jgi:intracellular septation protein